MQSIALNRNDEPTKPKLSDAQVEALRDALLILRTPCVFHHLMSVSPDTDVTILSSPLQQIHSLTLECDATFNQTNTKHSKSNIVSSESMVIPAYSKNGFNFGFMVAESYGLISKEFATISNGASTARFVTRESDGTLIATVRTNLVDILVCFQARNRSCACHDFIFPTGTLAPLIRSTINNDDDGLSALQRTICAAMVAENSLPCLNCGASTGQPCGCSIVLKSAKSALDLDAVKHNILRLHFGRMGGKGEYKLYGSNGGSHSIPVDFKVNISPNTRNGCAKKLVDLALEDMFKSMHIGVSRSVEPPTPVLEKSLLNIESHPNFKDESEDLFQSLNIGAALSVEPPPASEKAQANIESDSNFRDDSEIYSGLPHDTTPLFSSSNISSIPDFIDDPLWPWNTTSAMFENQIGNGEPVAFCQQGKSLAGSIVSSSKQTQPVTMSGDGSSMWPWNTTSTSTEKRIENEEALALRLQGQSAVTTTVSNSTSTHPLTMNSGHSIAKKTNSALRAKSIVPRTVPKKISGECDVPDFDDDEKMRQTEEQVRAWRAYKRKIRNRESAARSNRKRKQRLEIERRKKDTSSG